MFTTDMPEDFLVPSYGLNRCCQLELELDLFICKERYSQDITCFASKCHCGIWQETREWMDEPVLALSLDDDAFAQTRQRWYSQHGASTSAAGACPLLHSQWQDRCWQALISFWKHGFFCIGLTACCIGPAFSLPPMHQTICKSVHPDQTCGSLATAACCPMSQLLQACIWLNLWFAMLQDLSRTQVQSRETTTSCWAWLATPRLKPSSDSTMCLHGACILTRTRMTLVQRNAFRGWARLTRYACRFEIAC